MSTGTLAATLNAVTGSGKIAVRATGALAATLSPATLNAACGAVARGTLAAALDGTTLVATTITVPASTTIDTRLAATGIVLHSGTLSGACSTSIAASGSAFMPGILGSTMGSTLGFAPMPNQALGMLFTRTADSTLVGYGTVAVGLSAVISTSLDATGTVSVIGTGSGFSSSTLDATGAVLVSGIMDATLDISMLIATSPRLFTVDVFGTQCFTIDVSAEPTGFSIEVYTA